MRNITWTVVSMLCLAAGAKEVAAASTLPPWAQMVSDLGMTVVMGVLFIYLIRSGIPRLAQQFREDLAAERGAFREELREERQATGEIARAIEKNSQLLVVLIAKVARDPELAVDLIQEETGGTDEKCAVCPFRPKEEPCSEDSGEESPSSDSSA